MLNLVQSLCLVVGVIVLTSRSDIMVIRPCHGASVGSNDTGRRRASSLRKVYENDSHDRPPAAHESLLQYAIQQKQLQQQQQQETAAAARESAATTPLSASSTASESNSENQQQREQEQEQEQEQELEEQGIVPSNAASSYTNGDVSGVVAASIQATKDDNNNNSNGKNTIRGGNKRRPKRTNNNNNNNNKNDVGSSTGKVKPNKKKNPGKTGAMKTKNNDMNQMKNKNMNNNSNDKKNKNKNKNKKKKMMMSTKKPSKNTQQQQPQQDDSILEEAPTTTTASNIAGDSDIMMVNENTFDIMTDLDTLVTFINNGNRDDANVTTTTLSSSSSLSTTTTTAGDVLTLRTDGVASFLVGYNSTEEKLVTIYAKRTSIGEDAPSSSSSSSSTSSCILDFYFVLDDGTGTTMIVSGTCANLQSMAIVGGTGQYQFSRGEVLTDMNEQYGFFQFHFRNTIQEY